MALPNPFARSQEGETDHIEFGRGRFQPWTRRTLLFAAVVMASSCLSPTLPLPPPNKPAVEGPDASGNVTLSGAVLPGANVYANNLDSGASAGQKADAQTGKYRFRIGAKLGDSMEFFYIYDGVSSERSHFFIGGVAPSTDSSADFDAGLHFGAVDASAPAPR